MAKTERRKATAAEKAAAKKKAAEDGVLFVDDEEIEELKKADPNWRRFVMDAGDVTIIPAEEAAAMGFKTASEIAEEKAEAERARRRG